MQTNQDLFEQIEKLVAESTSKKPSPIKEDALKIPNRPKIFLYNKNRRSVSETWKEIEWLFMEKEEHSKIQKGETLEEHKVMEQKERSLKTPQPKISSESIETTKIKEPEEECQKKQIDTSANRKLIFDLD